MLAPDTLPVSTARPRNDFRTVHYAHGPARSPCRPFAALSTSLPPHSMARCFHAEPYQAKVRVVEFLNGVGKGAETHAAKLDEAVGGDLQRLLQARTLRLKKLGIPCKHRKLILSFAHKYRLGLWKPRAEPRKVE